jgi:hypothetical protein
MQMHDDDPIYSPDDAAKELHPNLSPRTLERWRTTGAGPDFVKIGRRVGYRQSDLNAFKQQRTRQHTSEEK